MEDEIKMAKGIMKLLKDVIDETRDDIVKIGGKKTLRGNLGTEDHVKWRFMYNLEKKIPHVFIQSPEAKIIQKNRTDLAVFSQHEGELKPEILIEFKMTNYHNLFEGKKEIEKDYTKLISVVKSLRRKDPENIPIFGLIIYLESKAEIKKYLAEKGCPKLFNEYKHLLHNYFEFIIREEEGDVVKFP